MPIQASSPDGGVTNGSSHPVFSASDYDSLILVDPATLTTRSSVLQALAELSQYSSSLEDELITLFQQSTPVVEQTKKDIVALIPQVELVRDEADILNKRLQESASVAKRISERVRLLDEERKRIALASEWTYKVSELKSSLISLAATVETRDWDTATFHCKKVLSIDKPIISSKFAAAVVPTTDLPEPPEGTLLSLRKEMLQAFTDGFIQATQDKDEQQASRFFKLFPQIGWKKEGLQVYSAFARSMVRDKGRAITENLGSGKAQSPTHFAMLLTSLFEHIATMIDMHQPVVDRHYGNGNFAHGVMPGLQEECDRLGLRILDNWKEDRGVRRKLDDIRNHRFTGINSLKTQPQLIRASFGGPLRTASPAGGRTANSSIDEPSGPDGREVDRILTELAAITSRWGLYRRFLNGRLKKTDTGKTRNSADNVLEDERVAQASEPLKDFRKPSISIDRQSLDSTKSNQGRLDIGQDEENDWEEHDVGQESLLGKQMNEVLSQIYIPMETWYLRNSLEKAFRIDQPDISARPYTSSILDDAFYVLRAVLSRIVSTSSVETVSEMLKSVKNVIEEEYIEVLVRKMENVWRSVSGSMTVDGPRKETATREMRTIFVTYLNVLDISSQYMERILTDVGNEEQLSRMLDPSEIDQVVVMVHSLGQLVTRFKSGLRTEIEQMFTQITAPRLKAILTESYRDISYVLDEDSYADAEYKDLVRRRFIKGWEHVFFHFKGIFTEPNHDTYTILSLESLLRPWENLILGMRFTELGALRFDKDLRGIMTFLTLQTHSPVRDKFTRLQQFSYVLNLDHTEEEENDLYQNAIITSEISWRLSTAEVKLIRSLRM